MAAHRIHFAGVDGEPWSRATAGFDEQIVHKLPHFQLHTKNSRQTIRACYACHVYAQQETTCQIIHKLPHFCQKSPSEHESEHAIHVMPMHCRGPIAPNPKHLQLRQSLLDGPSAFLREPTKSCGLYGHHSHRFCTYMYYDTFREFSHLQLVSHLP